MTHRAARVIALACLLAAALMAQPRRIVSTTPATTEILFALGLGDRVVGVSQYCHYPPEALKRPKVGTYLRPNVEVIAGLKPDLVVVESMPEAAAPKVKWAGMHALEITRGDLAVTLDNMQKIANACGVPDRGAKLVAQIRARLDAIRARTAKMPRRSLVFLVGRTTGRLDGMIAVGKGSYLNELMAIAGGANALENSPMPYLRVSIETVLGLNPDVIVDMGDMAETTGVTDEHKREVVGLWSVHRTVSAVVHQRVFAVASDIFVVPGPRLADAAEAFEKMLHPEAAR